MNAVRLNENVKKAEESIRKAIKLLEEARVQSVNTPAFKNLMWRAASELEYSALIISIVHGVSDFIPEIPKSNPGKVHPEILISESITKLNSVLERLSADPKESYADLRRVIHGIREIL